MHVLRLPPELVSCIARYLNRAREILFLAMANQQLFYILRPALYRFNVRRQNSSALIWAAQKGAFKLAKILISYNADVNAVHEGKTPLMQAAICGSESVSRTLLGVGGILINLQNEVGLSALWYAAAHGRTAIVEQLMERENIRMGCSDRSGGLTPLAIAACNGHADVVRVLLQVEQDDINTPDRHGRTPIFHAIRCPRYSTEVTEILLSKSTIDTSHRDSHGRTPVTYAALRRRYHAVALLLKMGADVNIEDNKGDTPLDKAVVNEDVQMTKALLGSSVRRDWSLLLATRRGFAEITRLLIEYGFNVNARERFGRTPLHLAAANGYQEVVTMLLSHRDIEVNAQDCHGETAMHEAAKKGYVAVLQSLLATPGIDINQRDENGATPLWLAIRWEHEHPAMQLLSRADVDVNGLATATGYQDRSTPLHWAVRSRNLPILRSLVNKDQLDPNITDSSNRTPLSWAAFYGDFAIVCLLLTRSDIRISPGYIHEEPSLWLAMKENHTEVIRKLVEHPSADMNDSWGDYEPPIIYCAKGDHLNIMALLLVQSERLDVNKRDKQGRTALLISASNGSPAAVDQILQHDRVDVSGADRRGRTALWWATYLGHTTTVRRLLQDNRVQFSVQNSESDTLLMIAKHRGHSQIENLLQHARLSAEQAMRSGPCR